MNLHPLHGLLAFFALLLLPQLALASGYYKLDPGAKAGGRGLAFVANPDDLSAMYYNPAGLAQQEGSNALVLLHLYHGDVEHKRATEYHDGRATSFETVKSNEPFMMIPNLALSHSFSEPDFVLGLGVFSPLDGSYDFPKQGPQRYAYVDGSVGLLTPMLTLAAKLSDELRVGLQFQYVNVWVRQKQAFALTSPDIVSFEGILEIDVESWTPSWAAGVSYDIDEQWTFGLAAQGQTNSRNIGDLTIDLPAIHLHEKKKAELVARLPWVARAGLQYHPSEALELEFAYVYTNWDSVGVLIVDLADNQIAGFDFPDIPVYKEFQDSESFRLGGDYKLSDDWALRAGYMYETPGISKQAINVSAYDGWRHLFSTGASWQAIEDSLRLDAAAGYIYYPPMTVRNSRVEAISGLGSDAPVANGSYNMRDYYFTLALNWQFVGP